MQTNPPNASINVASTHPLIKNANDFILERKYVSIDSVDRNMVKYPNAAQFDIELPTDYLNVTTIRLAAWAFPSNYSVFSVINNNLFMMFTITDPYNPAEHTVPPADLHLLTGIYDALMAHVNENFEILIQPGFYNPVQMATELTNKFNAAVTIYLREYFTGHPLYFDLSDTTYSRFQMVYNDVGQKIWFGNNADAFALPNSSHRYVANIEDINCLRKDEQPESFDWGLPYNIGFKRIDINSDQSVDPEFQPRFYYGDVLTTGDNGYWLVPNLPGANVYFVEPPYKINFLGPAYIYMDLGEFNSIDEYAPFNVSRFTLQTNESNGRVNASFAKIGIISTPISQWFDDHMLPFKYFSPPAERIRKLSVRFRYHNGQLVDFGLFNYSFMLEFTMLRPQIERSYSSIRDAYQFGRL